MNVNSNNNDIKGKFLYIVMPENSERDGNTRPPDLPLEICMPVRKQLLWTNTLDMDQHTGSK